MVGTDHRGALLEMVLSKVSQFFPDTQIVGSFLCMVETQMAMTL